MWELTAGACFQNGGPEIIEFLKPFQSACKRRGICWLLRFPIGTTGRETSWAHRWVTTTYLQHLPHPKQGKNGWETSLWAHEVSREPRWAVLKFREWKHDHRTSIKSMGSIRNLLWFKYFAQNRTATSPLLKKPLVMPMHTHTHRSVSPAWPWWPHVPKCSLAWHRPLHFQITAHYFTNCIFSHTLWLSACSTLQENFCVWLNNADYITWPN